MHRGRFGGNARKRKTKLDDDTFNAMITSPAAIIDGRVDLGDPVEVLDADAPIDLSSAGRAATSSTIKYLDRVRGGAFQQQDYRFGYTQCLNCRSDQAYYLHSNDLNVGFTFRCRICRHEVTVTVEQ